MNPTIKTLAIALAMGLAASGAFAAATASDTAGNYTTSWSASSTPNLGSGFGAWSVPNNNGNPPYAGTYLDLASYGNPDGVTGGVASWGTYANGGPPSPFVDLVRPFTTGGSGSANLFNQTFSFGIGSGGIGGTGSSIGAAVGTAFSLGYAGGGPDNFTLSVDGGAATPIPVTFANLNAGLLISLSVSGALNSTTEGYALTISPFAGGPAIYATSGTFNSAVYNTSSFTYSDNNTSNDQFVNALNITAEAVPEPASILFGLSGLVTLLIVRRKK
jgi:hypothetical protein